MASSPALIKSLLPAASAAALLGVAYYLILVPIYNVAFHPLRRYPGPKLWAMYRLPLTISMYHGYHHEKLLELHATYGEIVRVAPTRLSFVKPEAWKDIMGHRKAGMKENPKDPLNNTRNNDNIIGTPSREQHAAFRRTLSHAFSAKMMMDQEPLITQYIDLFFQKLREHARSDKGPLNIVSWYNSTTFDIIGDLAFGEPFGSLENSALHPWVALIFDNLRQNARLDMARKYIFSIDHLVETMFPSSIKALQQHEDYVRQKLDKRLARKDPRPDFMETMLRKDKNGNSQTYRQLEQNSNVLIIAGSETTATVLSFATYLLCKHPEVMQKARDEVLENFKEENEINLTSVQNLRYMLAVLDETMRLYPAAAMVPPRVAAEGGTEVLGEYIPENTELFLPQVVIYRWPANFAMADKFIPERWLGDPRFENDRRDAFNPFATGPRDCIGKNLAYAEMRVIFARMLFNFEMELDERSKDWTDKMPIWVLWDKPPMWLKIRERR